MNLPNFWYGSCSYGPLSENHTLYAGKILIWGNLVHLRPFLAKIDSFESFLVPRSAVGTYGLAFVRAFVRLCVRSAEISKSVHRNFLKFGIKLGLPNATEVTFSDFAGKIPFGPFCANLGLKIDI